MNAIDSGRCRGFLRVMHFEEHQHSLSERQMAWWYRITESQKIADVKVFGYFKG